MPYWCLVWCRLTSSAFGYKTRSLCDWLLFKHCRFIPANLEIMFSKYSCKVPHKLTLRELWDMTQANSVAYDFFGWSLLFLHVAYIIMSNDIWSTMLTLQTSCINKLSYWWICLKEIYACANNREIHLSY